MMLCPSSYFFGNERDKKCMNEIAAILRSKGICANPYVCTYIWYENVYSASNLDSNLKSVEIKIWRIFDVQKFDFAQFEGLNFAILPNCERP